MKSINKKSLRAVAALLLVLTLPTAAKAEVRNFTLASGQTVKATLTGLVGNQVSLTLEDGRRVTLDLSRLAADDRSYVLNNAPAAAPQVPSPALPAPAAPSQAMPSPGSVKLAWTKNRIGNKVQATDKDIINAQKTETWKCQFELTNSSRLRLENLSLSYEVSFRMKSRTGRKSSAKPYERKVTGVIQVPALDGFQSLKLETPEMKTTGTAGYVVVYDNKTRKYYDSGVRDLSMEEIEGVVVTVTKGGTQILRYVSPGMKDTVGR